MKKKRSEALIAFCFALTVFLFAPIELFISNRTQFWFHLGDILPMLLGLTAGAVVLLFILSQIMPSGASAYFNSLVFSITILFYVQGNYISSNYGILDGTEIEWENYASRMAINLLLWIAVIIFLFFLTKKNKRKLLKLQVAISSVLIVIEIVSLGVFAITQGIGKTQDKSEKYLTKQYQFELSSDNNVIVFLLDAFDGSAFENLYKSDPTYVEELFEDFVFYYDTVGGATRTKYAIPYIFTGQTNQKEQSYIQYLEDSFDKSPFFSSSDLNGKHIDLYTVSSYVDLSKNHGIENVYTGRIRVSSHIGLVKSFLKFVAYKYSPDIFKRYFWTYSESLEKWKSSEDLGAYAINDAFFYQELCEKGITVESEETRFKFYHLLGAHAPYTLNESAQRVAREESNEEKQIRGCFTIIQEYIHQMKTNNIYDSSTIIIMADHGLRTYSKYEQNPLLVIKMPNIHKPLELSDESLSYAVLPEVFLQMINKETVDIKACEKGTPRYFYAATEESGILSIKEYIIKGKAYDNDAIEETSVVYHGNTMNRSRLYRLGDVISFQLEDTAQNYIISGFSTNENDFTWTDGNTAELELELDRQIDQADIELNYSTFDGPQHVKLYINDQLVESYVAESKEKKTVHIGNGLIKDKKIRLRFELPDAHSPESIRPGSTDDIRKLSLAFRQIIIREAK